MREQIDLIAKEGRFRWRLEHLCAFENKFGMYSYFSFLFKRIFEFRYIIIQNIYNLKLYEYEPDLPGIMRNVYMSGEGRRYYFDGVKDMMKFYIFDGDFPYDRQKIESIFVTDFYTLEAIPAKKAWYVIGSEVYGPMGNELIPFKDKASAENFMKDHKGERILRFDEITGKIVMGLDGIDYSE
jgi:hypothetical protein